MPRIVVKQYGRAHPGEFLQRGISGAGEAFGQGITDYRKMRALAVQQATENEQKDRALDIEEARAKAQIAREQRLGATQGALSTQRQAQQSRVDQDLDQNMARQSSRSFLNEALSKPGGLLGPFGALDPTKLGKGAQKSLETQQRLRGKFEEAKLMGPVAARSFLEREVKDEKRGILADAYAREAKQIKDAVADGVIAPEEEKLYTKALKEQIKKQGPPGEVETRLAHNYGIVAKLKVRAGAWKDADKKAIEMFQTADQLTTQLGDGVDPITGESPGQAMKEKIALARGEWAKTEFPTHRMESDPEEQLGVLQKFLFGIQAEAGQGAGKTDAENQAMLSRPVTQQPGRTRPSGTDEEEAARGVPQAAIRAPETRFSQRGEGIYARNPDGSEDLVSAGEPGAKRGPRNLDHARIRQQMQGDFAQHAQRIFSSGGDVKANMKTLLVQIASDYGMDPTSPEFLSAVKPVIDSLMGRAPSGQ